MTALDVKQMFDADDRTHKASLHLSGHVIHW